MARAWLQTFAQPRQRASPLTGTHTHLVEQVLYGVALGVVLIRVIRHGVGELEQGNARQALEELRPRERAVQVEGVRPAHAVNSTPQRISTHTLVSQSHNAGEKIATNSENETACVPWRSVHLKHALIRVQQVVHARQHHQLPHRQILRDKHKEVSLLLHGALSSAQIDVEIE